ncbi:nucleotidyl transferase AbiEii/AbiGii toxin family protein [Lacticaseibacillus parakribbianus]|uniref:nucleotidyl transferase AbiEii/AbiGii toxin family protein n=1 Tax=Lacticaseibacillus parakribbianus TaxID=2970927 RepID=UPI0021CB1803|nr:nucleotidyl transferase AbiEii/AbiGii toxin family protein [Lacticaseibacillus parakribbianus]
MQEVVLDELADRISHSPYRTNLILKGGFLIASMLGVDTRSTRDMDTAIKGLPVTVAKISEVFSDIVNMNTPENDIQLTMMHVESIREDAEYTGYRVHMQARVFGSVIDTKVDVSTGDVITPREISWHHRTIFNQQDILVMAYNMETILAEKLETIVARQEANTRMKDFYDVYLFDKVRGDELSFKTLWAAIRATAARRAAVPTLTEYANIATALGQSRTLNERWLRYQKAFAYSRGITFAAACDAAAELIRRSERADG